MQVHLGYRMPRTFVMTPSRKRLGRAMARGSRKAVAVECLKEPTTRKHLLKRIGMLVRNELMSMCSERTSSILSSQSVTDLWEFTWEKLLHELNMNAPVLLTILQECTNTRRPRPNQNAVIGMCTVILLKHRFQKMSLVQKILSLILYAGHSGKQVITIVNYYVI